MARRLGSGLVALLTALVWTACSAGGSPVLESTTRSTLGSTTTTTTQDTTTTAETPSTVTTSAVDLPDVEADIVVPDGDGPFPAVVLVHGGGWVGGDPGIMRPLADYLNANGYLTVNTRYALSSLEEPGFPQAIDDVACAVRLAASHPDSDGTVALIGHSAGAHIGAVVALTGDDYAANCSYPGSGIPEHFVGLAGPYDVSRVGLLATIFFGATPDVAPAEWNAGNPQLLTDANTNLESLIMYGELDGLVEDGFAVDFANALETSGSSALLERVEGARHNDMDDPDLVGNLIVTWLER